MDEEGANVKNETVEYDTLCFFVFVLIVLIQKFTRYSVAGCTVFFVEHFEC